MSNMPTSAGTSRRSERSPINAPALRRFNANHMPAPAIRNSSGMRSRCARSIGSRSAGMVSSLVMCQPQPTNNMPVWKKSSTKIAMTRSQSRNS